LRRQLEIALARAGRGLLVHPEQERRVGEHELQRELDTGLEGAPLVPAALEEAAQQRPVARRDGAAIGAPRQTREDLLGARELVGWRPRGAHEDRAPARRVVAA